MSDPRSPPEQFAYLMSGTEAARREHAATERAKRLVRRFEMESMALHRIQREWLEREIAVELSR